MAFVFGDVQIESDDPAPPTLSKSASSSCQGHGRQEAADATWRLPPERAHRLRNCVRQKAPSILVHLAHGTRGDTCPGSAEHGTGDDGRRGNRGTLLFMNEKRDVWPEATHAPRGH